MEYKRLGKSGLKVSNVCLGTMQFGWTADEKQSFAIMDRAVSLGCNFFDTADIYSSWAEGNPGGVSEEIIGRWLSQSDVARDQLILATKVRGKMGEGPNDSGLSRHHILSSVEDSLHRLNTDYIDLYQVHWPDKEVELEETLQALDDLVRVGMVRYIGCSNYPAWLLMKSLWISDVRRLSSFATVQPHYNMMHREEFEKEMMPLCADQGIGVIPYSPLAGGFLTGKYRRGAEVPDSARAEGIGKKYMNERGYLVLDAVDEVAKEHDATVAQTSLAWILANPTISSAIVGANTIEQLEDSFKGAEIKLSPEQKEQLDLVSAVS